MLLYANSGNFHLKATKTFSRSFNITSIDSVNSSVNLILDYFSWVLPPPELYSKRNLFHFKSSFLNLHEMRWDEIAVKFSEVDVRCLLCSFKLSREVLKCKCADFTIQMSSKFQWQSLCVKEDPSTGNVCAGEVRFIELFTRHYSCENCLLIMNFYKNFYGWNMQILSHFVDLIWPLFYAGGRGNVTCCDYLRGPQKSWNQTLQPWVMRQAPLRYRSPPPASLLSSAAIYFFIGSAIIFSFMCLFTQWNRNFIIFLDFRCEALQLKKRESHKSSEIIVKSFWLKITQSLNQLRDPFKRAFVTGSFQ